MNPPEDRIIVVVRGGLVEDVTNVPKGVTVEVHDYDTEGAQPGELVTDDKGDEHFLIIIEGPTK
jgi:hypothetical protein